jgi:hypothetical protein
VIDVEDILRVLLTATNTIVVLVVVYVLTCLVVDDVSSSAALQTVMTYEGTAAGTHHAVM